ncbi:uncharacterized mitochondrial protein AtMg00810-like [Rutidosis leptorrhynchoides]|uniref:uncharacterized mitochondrial protein AtMg00810-like n=1 Tax=Rutidosis leptorrhynchoides TaxID=125765 RepID=UPI003A9A16F6
MCDFLTGSNCYQSQHTESAPKCPYGIVHRFNGYAQRVGFQHSRCYTSLFIYKQGVNMEFSMIDLGPLNYFPGLFVARTSSRMFLSQQKYASEIIESADMFGFQPVCLFMHDPREPHMKALRRILRYIQDTLDLDLQLFPLPPPHWSHTLMQIGKVVLLIDDPLLGIVYILVIIFCPGLPRDSTPPRSSADAEYRGLANAVAEI